MAKSSLHRSGEHGDDPQLCERAGGCNGGAAEAREVVAISTGDTFDDSERMKAAKLARQGSRGEIRQQGDEVSAAHAMDVNSGRSRALSNCCSVRLKKFSPLIGRSASRFSSVKRSNARTPAL